MTPISSHTEPAPLWPASMIVTSEPTAVNATNTISTGFSQAGPADGGAVEPAASGGTGTPLEEPRDDHEGHDRHEEHDREGAGHLAGFGVLLDRLASGAGLRVLHQLLELLARARGDDRPERADGRDREHRPAEVPVPGGPQQHGDHADDGEREQHHGRVHDQGVSGDSEQFVHICNRSTSPGPPPEALDDSWTSRGRVGHERSARDCGDGRTRVAAHPLRATGRTRVARIVLARPQTANAQDYRMLTELNQAFDRAARDESVRVIILAADGNHFSSGHDLRAGTDMDGIDPVGTWCCFGADGAEGYMATEAEMYVGLCWRWRNIPKPTIAQVQGKVIAGGLMLVWPMDLVVCSDDATFADPVVAFGVNGHEYFTHPYEAGARLAKEMLFTGRAITADEALRHGMVNQVVPRDELESATLALAEHIARRPMFGLTLAKQSVNNSLDAMGMYTAIQSAFGLHHVGHNHNLRLHDSLVDPAGLQIVRDEA